MRFWIIVLSGLGLVLLLFALVPERNLNSDDWGRLSYLLALGVLVAGGVFASYQRVPISKTLKHIGVWLALGFVCVVLYSFRNEFPGLRQEIFPYEGKVEGERVTFRVADDGHYHINATVNGEPVRFMVDTGATSILLSADDARRLGFREEDLNYSQRFYTANGEAWGAPVTIATLRIGPITAYDIPASVGKGGTNLSLLGMNFLSKLGRVEISNETLTIEK